MSERKLVDCYRCGVWTWLPCLGMGLALLMRAGALPHMMTPSGARAGRGGV